MKIISSRGGKTRIFGFPFFTLALAGAAYYFRKPLIAKVKQLFAEKNKVSNLLSTVQPAASTSTSSD